MLSSRTIELWNENMLNPIEESKHEDRRTFIADLTYDVNMMLEDFGPKDNDVQDYLKAIKEIKSIKVADLQNITSHAS